MKILAAVVTHNRKNLLERCLDHLDAQELKPDQILIINNDSTDGTEKMLLQRGVEFITQENTGSAGGWHTAIDYALTHGFDYCWLMDDDGYPDQQALKILSSQISPSVSCVSSVVLKENDKDSFVFPFPVLNKNKFPVLFARKRRFFSLSEMNISQHNFTYQFAHLFNGALLNMHIVDKVGNINKQYFIMGDEVDFFYRLRAHGEVLTSFKSKHFHPDVSSRPYSPEKIYFLIKNTVILNYLYLDYKFLRSVLNIPVVLYRTGKRNGLRYLFYALFGQKNFFFYRAIKSGFKGKLGNDFKL